MRMRLIVATALVITAFGLPTMAQDQRAITEQQTVLNETILSSLEEEANRWRITTEEYQQYLEAIKGPRGRLSDPGITPIEVLGIEAKNSAERERFARLWVDMIRHDTAKTLAYTRSVHDAWLAIAPDRKLIDPMLLKKLKLRSAQYSGNNIDIMPSRLIVFTSMDCAPCNAAVGDLLDELESGRHLGLDFYLLGAAGDVERIQTWARERNIPLEKVEDRKITLNIERGELETLKESLGVTSDELPLVVRRQGDQYALIKPR